MKNEAKEPPLPHTPRDTSRRFTDAEVYEIRRRVRAGETKASLADEFHVSRPTIADAVHGLNTYADV